jgi:hypothetical protein
MIMEISIPLHVRHGASISPSILQNNSCFICGFTTTGFVVVNPQIKQLLFCKMEGEIDNINLHIICLSENHMVESRSCCIS